MDVLNLLGLDTLIVFGVSIIAKHYTLFILIDVYILITFWAIPISQQLFPI